MPFAMSSFWEILGYPSSQVPVSVTSFTSYVIPPVAFYFISAILVITPQTGTARAALWPVVALLALRAIVCLDMSLGKPEMKYLNTDLMLSMSYIAINTLSWAFAKKPLVRHYRPANGSPSVVMDALDLSLNPRGIGWDWSHGFYVPRETRPANRIAFALYALLSWVIHAILCGILCLAIRTLTADTSPNLGPKIHTIYDESLPPIVRYLRASVISTMATFGIYASLQLIYDLSIVLGVFVLGQDPAQWPPAFDRPWCATSLSEFWGRRWHQWLRHMFLLVTYPSYVVLGRGGRVISVFLASAVLHHAVMLTFDSRSEFWRMLIGFGMMAPGILAERAFYKLTRRKVGGAVGWIWMMTWLLAWGNVLVDGLARAGVFMSLGPIDDQLPARALVETLVANFDAWLHTV